MREYISGEQRNNELRERLKYMYAGRNIQKAGQKRKEKGSGKMEEKMSTMDEGRNIWRAERKQRYRQERRPIRKNNENEAKTRPPENANPGF
jgi:hypothetical protein